MIEQATGILMGYYGASPATALDALTSLASRAGITVYAIAETLIKAQLSSAEAGTEPGSGIGAGPEAGSDPLTMIAAALRQRQDAPRSWQQP